jgi:hypothetical protein
MNILKAIGAGLLVFSIQFTSVTVLGNAIGPFLGTSATAGYVWQGAMILLLIAIVYFTSKWYFTGNPVSALKGALLGASFVVTSLVLNLLQTIPAIAAGQNITTPLLQYVTSIPFIITVVITIGAAAAAGHFCTKRSACKIEEAVGNAMPTPDKVAATMPEEAIK